MEYVCTVCGYVYDPTEGDPDSGISPGTAFEDLPDDCHYRPKLPRNAGPVSYTHLDVYKRQTRSSSSVSTRLHLCRSACSGFPIACRL